MSFLKARSGPGSVSSGFSLLEVLVASIVTSLGLASLAAMSLASLVMTTQARDRTEALLLTALQPHLVGALSS